MKKKKIEEENFQFPKQMCSGMNKINNQVNPFVNIKIENSVKNQFNINNNMIYVVNNNYGNSIMNHQFPNCYRKCYILSKTINKF